jgi:hypothetical protein
VKNGATTPIVDVRPVESARAAALGSYSSASIASSTRMRVDPRTAVESLSTRETVPTPTPASAATLAIVLKRSLGPSTLFLWKRFHPSRRRGCVNRDGGP